LVSMLCRCYYVVYIVGVRRGRERTEEHTDKSDSSTGQLHEMSSVFMFTCSGNPEMLVHCMQHSGCAYTQQGRTASCLCIHSKKDGMHSASHSGLTFACSPIYSDIGAADGSFCHLLIELWYKEQRRYLVTRCIDRSLPFEQEETKEVGKMWNISVLLAHWLKSPW
jgi:hypothetical protein